AAFPPATRAQGEAVIQKELKDGDPATLQVRVGDALLAPFHTADDDGPRGERRRGFRRNDNHWRCTVAVDATAPDAHARIMEALNGGADALELLGRPTDLRALLKDVHVGAIDLAL